MPSTATMDFTQFKRAVATQFERMCGHALFTAAVSGDVLWDTYLASFPPGTNPVYRKRAEFDCSCCRQFIRRVGAVVAIIDGVAVSVWDIKPEAVDDGFAVVAATLSALVKGAPIDNAFLTYEATAGTSKSFEKLVDGVKTWEHFFANIPPKFVVAKDRIGPTLSDTRATHDVMLRGLKELTADSVDTALELIGQGSLYRGEEQKFALQSFAAFQAAFRLCTTDTERESFVWSRLDAPASVSRIRNTAIGTFLIDLSEGKEVEEAVRAWEVVVAPANYKRPTALVTKAQVERAKQAIADLGLTSALERRFATLTDITVNNVLFADRDARKIGGNDVWAEIGGEAKERNFAKVEEVGVEAFLRDVLPKATGVEAFVENRHVPNLVSLIAPVDATAKRLFKWDNGFSWSYNGDMADSIKERVKTAGGNVTGELCCRLAWDYTDDLDFHMHEANGYHIFYPNKRKRSPNGGELDLDANGGDGPRDDPAENIVYDRIATMADGLYRLEVNNYNRRSDGKGFAVEIDIQGAILRIAYDKALRTGETIVVATLKRTRTGVEIVSSLPGSAVTKKVWGLNTQNFHRVTTVMLSPNHWDGHGVGNRHFFFMIDGCQNDGRARGFFNEFLTEELTPHRKVIEIVGSKMKTDHSEHQLSGLGFSSTQRNDLLCRVRGAFTRVVRVKL